MNQRQERQLDPLPNDQMGTEAPNHGSVLDATNVREKLKQLIGVSSLV